MRPALRRVARERWLALPADRACMRRTTPYLFNRLINSRLWCLLVAGLASDFFFGGFMSTAYIVAAARTAGARKGGRLSQWHPADLAGRILDVLVERTHADPALIDDVV